MKKGTYKIVIKGKEKGVWVRCKGLADRADIMSGMTQAFIGTAKNLGFTIDDIIGCLDNECKEKPIKKSPKKETAKKEPQKRGRKAKGETKND